MPREGKTGLTIRPSTYQYAKERKESTDITWSDIVEVGMVDIANRGYVQNPVTDTSSDPNASKTIEVDEDVFVTAKDSKEAFHSRVTWDDVVVHGARSLSGEGEGDEDAGLSDSEREEVREIVEEVVDERLSELEVERDDDGDGISEADLEVLFREFLKENVVRNARAPELR